MDFKQLEYFRAIQEEGSISRAAEKMYISQQGLSKAIHALEKELDCKLFERNAKGVLLTKAGEALLMKAERVLAERDGIVRDMTRFREHDKLSIHMVIGSRFSMPKGFFKEFLKEYPDIAFDMQELKNEICLYNLEQGKADLSVVIASKRKQDYRYVQIKKERLTLVIPKSHKLAEKKEILLSDLEGQVMVYHSGTSSDLFLEQCKKQNISFEKKIEVPGMLALYQTCSNMGAVGISLASLEGKMAFDDLVEIPVAPKDVSWDVTLVYHESMEKVKAVKAFLDFLKEKLSDEGR